MRLLGKVKICLFLTKKQYGQLLKYMEYCECYATPAELATRLVSIGLADAVKRGIIDEG